MGLIRSRQTHLTPLDDEQLTDYLWPIVREMIKTAIENHQNLIVEGCYIPFNWKDDFTSEYLKEIRYCCLIMSQDYIENHFDSICAHACDVESRMDDSGLEKNWLIAENIQNLQRCRQYSCPYILLDNAYDVMDKVGGILWPTSNSI